MIDKAYVVICAFAFHQIIAKAKGLHFLLQFINIFFVLQCMSDNNFWFPNAQLYRTLHSLSKYRNTHAIFACYILNKNRKKGKMEMLCHVQTIRV